MGGSNPGSVAPVQDHAGKTIGQINNLRVHENITTGEVHFHDDNAGIKFACSCPDFEAVWNEGMKTAFVNPIEIIGHDGKDNPMIAVITRVASKGDLDVAVEIRKPNLGSNLRAIMDVVNG